MNKNKVSDNFYDHIDYYDSRNMFINLDDEIKPENRLYTNLNIKKDNFIWDQKKEDKDEEINRKLILENLKNFKKENNKNLACKLCGFNGHLAYQCRNNINIKLNKNINKEKEKTFLENFIKLRKEEKKLEKDNLFQKLYKNKFLNSNNNNKSEKKYKNHHHHHHSHNKKYDRSRSKSK